MRSEFLRLDFLPAADERGPLRAELAWTKRFLLSRWVLPLVGSLYLAAELTLRYGRAGFDATGRIPAPYPYLAALHSLIWMGLLFVVFRERVLLPFRGEALPEAPPDSIPRRAIFPALLVAPFAILVLQALPRIGWGLFHAVASLSGPSEPATPRQIVVPAEDAATATVANVAVEAAPSLDPWIDSVLGTTRGFVIGFAFLCFAAGACARGARSGEAILRWLAAGVAWAGATHGWSLLRYRALSGFGPMDHPSRPIDLDAVRPSDLLLRLVETHSFDSFLRLLLAAALAILALRALQAGPRRTA